jgi:predicted DNA-binding transcriptional regulator AlpA
MSTAILSPAPLLDSDQVAELLNVTRKTLEVWRCVRRYPALRYIRVGRAVRYRPEDVQAFLDSRTVGAAAE